MSRVQRTHDRIVVGVDGSAVSQHAVLWAAAEAKIRHSDLIVTHVEAAVPATGATQDEADLRRHLMLAASATVASTRQPGVAVGTLLIGGNISDRLVELSQSAAMLVIGLDRAVSRAAHGASGPVEDRVMAHAWCPVVVVSEPQPMGDTQRETVLVGLTAGAGADDLLHAAAAEAVVRHAALSIMIGSSPESADSEPDIGGPADIQALEQAIDALRQRHPQLTTRWNAPTGHLVDELERESSFADLLVVGGAQSADRWSIRTGALSSELTRRSHCPVMVMGRRVERRAEMPVSAA